MSVLNLIIRAKRLVTILRWVIVNMKDYIFADAVAQALQSDKENDLKVEKVYTPNEIEQYRKIASIVLMEVSGLAPYNLEERLKIRDMLKAANPDCKVVLVVDENSEKETAKQIRQAKKNGIIDQFLYGSVSAAYLSAVIDTL